MTELIIDAKGLVKRFGSTVALDRLDVQAPRGAVTAVLGPNGAGKTTFVRAVATLLRLDEGTLHVAGMHVKDQSRGVRAAIGLAGQSAAVEPAMTGFENLQMVARLYGQSRRDARRNARQLIERLRLTHAAGRRVRTYSGGMRRRLDLGASLVARPRLLLLDEPTTGLDPRSRIELWDMIRELIDDGTDVLLTTQYLEEADALADLIVIIDHGRAIASGTPSQLKEHVGGTVLELQVRDARLLDIISDKLATAIHRTVTTHSATRRLTVAVDDGISDMARVLPALSFAEGIDRFALRQPSLDEVFLALTGEPATHEAQPGTTQDDLTEAHR